MNTAHMKSGFATFCVHIIISSYLGSHNITKAIHIIVSANSSLKSAPVCSASIQGRFFIAFKKRFCILLFTKERGK